MQRQGRLVSRAALLALSFVVVGAVPARSRLLFDRADPALGGAIVVPLDASIGLAPGLQSLQIAPGGAQVTFSTTNPSGLLGGAWLTSYAAGGVQLDFQPPAEALGFAYLFGECGGIVDVDGAVADEHFQFPFASGGGLFVGASDIGEITSVYLTDACFAAAWPELRFVPSSGGPPPTDEADLALSKLALDGYAPPLSTTYRLGVSNAGPDPAMEAQIVDFLPQLSSLVSASVPASVQTGASHAVATLSLGDLPGGGLAQPTLEVQPPPFGSGTFCGSGLFNVAIATSRSLDLSGGDNLATSTVRFDDSSRQGLPEVCDNAHDDDCDGRVDCGEPSCFAHPHCRPPAAPPGPGTTCWGGLLAVPGVGVIDACGNLVGPPAPVPGSPEPPPPPAPQVECSFPSRCAGQRIRVAPHCCEEPPADRLEWLERAAACVQQGFAGLAGLPPQCQVGREDVAPLSWMGMPVDPNFKEADPPVNVFGHGFTEAGRTMTYTLHYENVGTADAHDVLVIDPLPPDLDDGSLVVNDGGVYDAATRTIRWRDAVLPPATPRSVSFSAAVRGDAPLGSRIRNVATVIFPDAVPPSRIDTNFVEHRIPLAGERPEPDLRLLGCTEAAPDEWRVQLANWGAGFAYDVRASVVDAPADVEVVDPDVRFSHPDDLDPATLATVMPATTTTSDDVVELRASSAGDPCPRLAWRVEWRDAAGTAYVRDVPATAPAEDCGNCVDDDGDGAIDARDGDCPSGRLDVGRSVLVDARRADRDRMSLRASFAAPPTGFDPIASGASVALFDGERLVACLAVPPGAGWSSNRRGTRWLFRDARDGSLADPAVVEKVRIRSTPGGVRVLGRLREAEIDALAGLSGGELSTAVSVGEHRYAGTATWRSRGGGRGVVTP